VTTASEADDIGQKLTNLGELWNDPAVQALDRAYAILTILDSKAGGLMAVNAFLGAFQALSIEKYRSMAATACVRDIALGMSFGLVVLLIISASLCFFVVRVEWDFLHHMKKEKTGESCKAELAHLSKAIVVRTRRYRGAWWITFVCLFGLLVLATIYSWG